MRWLVLTSRDVPSARRISFYTAVDENDIREGKELFVKDLSGIDEMIMALEKEKNPSLSMPPLEPITLDGNTEHYPIRITYNNLYTLEGDKMHPLESSLMHGDKPRPTIFPSHRAFVIHSSGSDLNDIKIAAGMEHGEEQLIETILDVPVEVIETESPQNDQSLRISTECIALALELIKETPLDLHRIRKLWVKSRIGGLLRLVVERTSKIQDDGTDELPAHVRDYIAALLTTKLPDALPPFEKFVKIKGSARRDNLAEIIQNATKDAEKQQSVLRLPPINPFTLRFRLRKILSEVTISTLAVSEPEFELAFEEIEKEPINPSRSVGSLTRTQDQKLPAFVSLRSKLEQLGTSLDSHVVTCRRGFFSSSLLGAGATGLLITSGVDPVVGLAIFALIAEVSRRKFVSEIRELWKAYLEMWSNTVAACFSDLTNEYLHSYKPIEERDLKLYNEKKLELEVVKKEVKEARQLLLDLAPSLKPRYPEWQKPEEDELKPTEP